MPTTEVTVGHALMAQSLMHLIELEEHHTRPGWTVLASDVKGMPWGDPDSSTSHGTWASHDVCGTVQKITVARPECRSCPPEPDSRTHRAKARQPHDLYNVRYLDLQKFGHGDANRIRAHLRAGAKAVEVLRGPHREVVAAEQQPKWALRSHLIYPPDWDLPPSFGTGSEGTAVKSRSGRWRSRGRPWAAPCCTSRARPSFPPDRGALGRDVVTRPPATRCGTPDSGRHWLGDR